MPLIAVSARADAPADTRVVGVFDNGGPPDDAVAAALVDSGEAKGGLKKIAVGHDGDRRVIVVGLGKEADFDVEKARVAAAVAAQRARELGAKSLAWALPPGD